MRIIKISQSKDREAWLEFRRAKIMGSNSKSVLPLTRGVDRTPAGFWSLLAEKISVARDGEKEMERGHRLENEGLAKTAEKYGIKFDLDPGVWISDEHGDLGISPDAAEPGDTPTYAGENKSLDSAKHIKFIYKDMQARKLENYNPINSIPNEVGAYYKDQVIEYFLVNEHLKTLYFTLYDDRIAYEHLEHYVIVVNRSDVDELVEKNREAHLDTLENVEKIIKQLTGELHE